MKSTGNRVESCNENAVLQYVCLTPYYFVNNSGGIKTANGFTVFEISIG